MSTEQRRPSVGTGPASTSSRAAETKPTVLDPTDSPLYAAPDDPAATYYNAGFQAGFAAGQHAGRLEVQAEAEQRGPQ